MDRNPQTTKSLSLDACPDQSDGLVRLLHTHLAELLAAIFIGYVLLGTLLPFDFAVSHYSPADRGWMGLGTAASGKPDLLSNIALYIPLGALLYLVFRKHLDSERLSFLIAVLVGAGLSLGVESLQLLSKARVSSAMDTVANVVGSLGGAGLASLCTEPAARMFRKLKSELRRRPQATFLRMYVALLVIAGVAPFTPTIDVTRVLESARSSTWSLFGPMQDAAMHAETARTAGELHEAASWDRARMGWWARWAAEGLSFSVLGWLLYAMLLADYRFSPGRALALNVYLIAVFALALGAVQILVMHRGFHLTDVAARVLGGMAGGVLHAARIVRNQTQRAEPVPSWLLPLGTAVALGFILFTGLIPFRFDDASRSVADKLASDDLLPFFSYFQARFDRVCADFWSKSLQYAVFGAMAWLWLLRASRASAGRATITLFALVLAIGIEAAQLTVLTRVPSLTDPLIAAAATFVGILLVQAAWEFYRSVGQTGANRRSGVQGQPRLSVTDTLVATLIPDEAIDQTPREASEQPASDNQHH